MEERKIKLIKYSVVVILIVCSFFICYYSFLKIYSPVDESVAKQDKLSGQMYGIVYPEENPYGPYFIGFDNITDQGVSNDDRRYILDVLTNFSMYNKKIYKAKISYVKDSFEKPSISDTAITYSFKFGINDSDIYKIKVVSDIVVGKITMIIHDDKNAEVFNKTFDIYSS